VFLPVFLAFCSILELEAAISTVFATFWRWNLSFSIEFAAFGEHVGAGSCRFKGWF
jgi:hypothetical protein